jgi:hypothetical protein
MRRAVLAVILALASTTPAFGQPQSPSAPPDRLLTPQEDTAQSMTSVAESPLNDLNLKTQKIPPILLAALNDPYAPLDRLNCRSIGAEIDRLYAALGRDFDDPPPPKDTSVKGATKPGGDGLKLMHSAAQMFIPYDGVVRTLSGAQKRDEKVMAAINAGDARRAYLKGLGEARNCPAPAAPRGHGRGETARTQFW